jgi:hypothetical protein
LRREGLGSNNENIKIPRGIMLREWLVPWGRVVVWGKKHFSWEVGCVEMKWFLGRKVVLKRGQCFWENMFWKELDVIPPKCVFIRNIVFLWGKVYCVSSGRYGNK